MQSSTEVGDLQRRVKTATVDGGLHQPGPEEHHMVRVEPAEPGDREAFRVERDSVRGGSCGRR